MSVIIIAEAGVNHNGDIDKALKLVKVAADAGADFVKFQTFKTELNISKAAEKANYQKKGAGIDESQFEMVKRMELTYNQFIRISKECLKHNISFLSTAFDNPSIDFIDSLNPEFFKIPSGEVTNKLYLRYIAGKKRPVVLSTGMSNLQEVKEAVAELEKGGLLRKQVTVLHCNTEYPTPMKDVNLKAMLQIGDELGVEVGYSDHTLGIEVPIAAVALGACIIEKHFTLDRNLKGPDHSASLEPSELKSMIRAIRNVEMAISGSGMKETTKSEKINIDIARKSLFTSKPIRRDTRLTQGDLIALRPGDGISPMRIDELIGKKVKSD